MNRIYLDHAATTPVSTQVLEAMMPFFNSCWGTASSVYGTGREARKAVEKARRQVAEAIGAEPREILFTGGGSESDNLAVKGTAFALKEKGKHIITTAIEHPAVLNTCRWLEKQEFEVTYINPDKEGYIAPEKILSAVREDTILISMMAATAMMTMPAISLSRASSASERTRRGGCDVFFGLAALREEALLARLLLVFGVAFLAIKISP